MQTLIDAPLSAFDSAPATDETRSFLIAAGIDVSTVLGLTELGAQNLLLLHAEADDSSIDPPHCYQHEYDPNSLLCRGCLFQPRCWRSDLRYLQSGANPPPSGVPTHAVAARLAWAANKTIPAVPSVSAPPSPVSLPKSPECGGGLTKGRPALPPVPPPPPKNRR
jgi:hypothetical protein